MPRTPINTVFTPRTKPNTTYKKPRDREEYPVSFDSVEWTFDSTEITFDMTFRDLGPITTQLTPRATINTTITPNADRTAVTQYNTQRYGKYLRDVNGENVFDLLGEQVQGISGYSENKIVTKYI